LSNFGATLSRRKGTDAGDSGRKRRLRGGTGWGNFKTDTRGPLGARWSREETGNQGGDGKLPLEGGEEKKGFRVGRGVSKLSGRLMLVEDFCRAILGTCKEGTN